MAYRAMTRVSKIKPLCTTPSMFSTNKRFQRKFHDVWKSAQPVVPFFEGVVFSKKAITHHWGVIPIIVITLVGFTTEVLYTIRNALTRDDVQFTKNPPACEVIETRQGYPAPIRKFRVYNQKYEVPPALIEAQQGNVIGPKQEGKKK